MSFSEISATVARAAEAAAVAAVGPSGAGGSTAAAVGAVDGEIVVTSVAVGAGGMVEHGPVATDTRAAGAQGPGCGAVGAEEVAEHGATGACATEPPAAGVIAPGGAGRAARSGCGTVGATGVDEHGAAGAGATEPVAAGVKALGGAGSAEGPCCGTVAATGVPEHRAAGTTIGGGNGDVVTIGGAGHVSQGGSRVVSAKVGGAELAWTEGWVAMECGGTLAVPDDICNRPHSASSSSRSAASPSTSLSKESSISEVQQLWRCQNLRHWPHRASHSLNRQRLGE